MARDLFAELDTIAITTPVEKGSFVYSSGDQTSAVYVVRSGKIAITWADHEVYPPDMFEPGSDQRNLPPVGFKSRRGRHIESIACAQFRLHFQAQFRHKNGP